MMARLKGWVMRHADAISVVSTPMTRFAVELGADAAKISIIPMGVDFGGLFTPGVGDTRKSGEILFVGRLVEKKGLKYLIQAMPLISVRVPHAHLTIAGYGPEEHSLRGLVAQMGLVDKVAFLGAVPQRELPNLYRGASVFVAPFVQVGSGDQEGLPVALMEAIACGCPVVAGELEVLADIFTQDEADMQVDPRDTKAFADKVAGVLLHGGVACRRMTRIRARLAARLAWDTIARQYAGILNGLLPSAKAER
jgi:glycosyltransferase involved in cell wall biosynthesis